MIDKLLEYLQEDLGSGDITTDSLISKNAKAKARIICREGGVIAGVEEIQALCERFSLRVEAKKRDGNRIRKGEAVAFIDGNYREILKLERLLLNLLSRMSGIATLTKRLADLCAPLGVRVMGTRKTTPGFRAFEKKAIKIGGGLPHRTGLFDAVLIKDNHLLGIGIREAVEKTKADNPGKKVEVEVEGLKEAIEAAQAGSDTILLDNTGPTMAKRIIDELNRLGLRKRVQIELSGGIGEGNIQSYSKAGADTISLGMLTTGARWLDFSLEVEKVY